jgi:hypothetical protein
MLAMSPSRMLDPDAGTGTFASASGPSSAPSTRSGTRVVSVSTSPPLAMSFCAAIAREISGTVTPSAASRVWLNSTYSARGISPEMVTFSAPGTRSSRSRTRSACRVSSALSAPVSANTAP